MYVGGAVVVAVKSRGTSGDMCAKNLNAAFLGKDSPVSMTLNIHHSIYSMKTTYEWADSNAARERVPFHTQNSYALNGDWHPRSRAQELDQRELVGASTRLSTTDQLAHMIELLLNTQDLGYGPACEG